MDRPGILSLRHPPTPPREIEPIEEEYSPVKHPLTSRELLRKLFAPDHRCRALLLKFGFFALKFFGIFISVAGYALIWAGASRPGFVLLIAGARIRATTSRPTRQGLKPSLPVFIPFLGAYVAMKNAPFDPWRNLLVSAQPGRSWVGSGPSACGWR